VEQLLPAQPQTHHPGFADHDPTQCKCLSVDAGRGRGPTGKPGSQPPRSGRSPHGSLTWARPTEPRAGGSIRFPRFCRIDPRPFARLLGCPALRVAISRNGAKLERRPDLRLLWLLWEPELLDEQTDLVLCPWIEWKLRVLVVLHPRQVRGNLGPACPEEQ
jgi:hypothetical protein